MKRTKALAVVLAALALAGCKEYECVSTGPIDVPDYIYMPMTYGSGTSSFTTMTPILVGFHQEVGCVEWKEKEPKQ